MHTLLRTSQPPRADLRVLALDHLERIQRCRANIRVLLELSFLDDEIRDALTGAYTQLSLAEIEAASLVRR